MTPVWQRRPPRARAALLALAVTWAFLLALNTSLLRPEPVARPEQPALTVLLLPPPTGPQRAPAAAVAAPPAPKSDKPRRAASPVASLPSRADALPAAPMAAPGSAPIAAAQPASAPLRLDDQVLRAAARYSIGRTRELAEASGQTLGSGEPLSTQERLSQAAARSAKPDCLGPNAGGSLLTLPFLAFDAATGRCK